MSRRFDELAADVAENEELLENYDNEELAKKFVTRGYYSLMNCKDEKIKPMKRYIIGAITDYRMEDIEPWVASVTDLVPKVNPILVSFNTRQEIVDGLSKYGVQLVQVPSTPNMHDYAYFYKPRSQFNICVDRFLYISKLLKGPLADRLGSVLITDVKDVVFQKNPFSIMESKLTGGKFIAAASEGIQYKNEPWGHNNMHRSYPLFAKDMMDRTIYNAGVIGGHGTDFADFLLDLYFYSKAAQMDFVDGGGGPDQAAYNILLSQERWSDKTAFITASSSFACIAGTMNDPSKAYMWPNLLELQPVFDENEGVIDPLTRRAHAIVHQYDRITQWNDYFTKKYRYPND